MTEIKERKLIAKECKFALHLPSKDSASKDIHMVKERLFYEDGTEESNLTFIENFQRPFWLTKPKFRNFQQKKEYQEIEKLDMYKCTESRLTSTLARVLGKPGSKEHLKALCNSPYVYGADIPSISFIKRMYQRKWNKVSENSLCVLDIETDVINGTELPILVGAVMKDKAIIAVTEDFIKGFDNPIERLEVLTKQNINKVLEQLSKDEKVKKDNREVISLVEKVECKVEWLIVKDCVEAIKATMARVHKWMPDFLAVWNINFDIPKIISTLEHFNVDPADVFCDPKVPKSIRVCKYKEGNTKKVTASGKVQPISPADQWHTFHLSASFYCLDAMCTYRLIRLGAQEKSSYALDNILGIELGIGKLKLTDSDNFSGLKWHQEMQARHKLFYCVYNFFDSYSVILLDVKTKDIAFTFTSMSECTPFFNFKRQPQRIITSLFFYLLEKTEGGRFVLASMGEGSKDDSDGVAGYDGDDSDVDTDDDEDDDEDGLSQFGDSALSLSGWIVTLPAHMAALGNKIIKECPNLRTMIRAFSYDSDATSAYPSATEVTNLSKVNTKRSVIAIEGIEEDVFRIQNMNLSTGAVNALEYNINMFNAPGPFEILDMV